MASDEVVVTEEMLAAAREWRRRYRVKVSLGTLVSAYRAMHALAPTAPQPQGEAQGAAVPVLEIVRALEREAANTDTDCRWVAANALRQMAGWEQRTLICDLDTRPSEIAMLLPPATGTGEDGT